MHDRNTSLFITVTMNEGFSSSDSSFEEEAFYAMPESTSAVRAEFTRRSLLDSAGLSTMSYEMLSAATVSIV